MTVPRRPTFASQDWILEQQLRAEMEAEAWRRLREVATVPELLPGAVLTTIADDSQPDYHHTGSAILKGLVRFALAAIAGYVAWIAAIDLGLGEFEAWLIVIGVSVIFLAFTLLLPALVHMLSEILRWTLVVAAVLGVLWLLVQVQG